eukprot:CAMPEP_0168569812 /NCGR_PEP_ID=MMETSP0413-20121227/16378_1 /TAXON_ID=136452 /ORGANISM="Filamoeba nolandi, Strain NC-AS-23-1" /LENGTH=84 /DNA_ID=CAMNT_0008602375 /DNA_START=30 /DNA_END=284 /DNA_ORIENTATION=-
MEVKNITVEVGENKSFNIPSLRADIKGSDLKAKIQHQSGIAVGRVFIKGLNNEIQDDRPLADYEIAHNDTLVAFPRVQGGTATA